MAQLTQNQSIALIASLGVGVLVQTVAAHKLVKHVEEIEEKYKASTEVGQNLARIAMYQEQLLSKHVEPMHLDDFDRMAMNDMSADLKKQLEELKRLHK